MADRVALIVTGTRDELTVAQVQVIRESIAAFIRDHRRPDIVIHGDCPTGVDALVEKRCALASIQTLSVPADWPRHDNAAGPVRNTAMVQLAKCLRDGSTYEIHWLAFPKGESTGTRDCVRKCEAAGFTGQIVELEP